MLNGFFDSPLCFVHIRPLLNTQCQFANGIGLYTLHGRNNHGRDAISEDLS